MTALYAHALRLHREHPDTPLPQDGKPYPGHELLHRRSSPREDPRRRGAAAAALLDSHFGRRSATPAEHSTPRTRLSQHPDAARPGPRNGPQALHFRQDLAAACHDVAVPIHPDDHIATAAHLHEAITRPGADAALVDHTSRLLIVMSGAQGMGMTLDTYPPADLVLAAHAEALGTLPPTPDRYRAATRLADIADGRWPEPLRRYRALLARPDWVTVSPPG